MGGVRASEIAMMLWLFLAGLGALVARKPFALGLLLAAYLGLLALDPLAAGRAEVPLCFARLQLWQMAVPVGCLAVLLWGRSEGGGTSAGKARA